MQHPGQHLFAGTRGADQQGGDFGLRHALGQGQQLLADRVDKHKTFRRLGFDVQCGDGIGPQARVPFVGGQHMQSTQTHRVHSHFHAPALDTANHRHAVAQLANQGLHFAQEFGVVTQADDQHMGTAQGHVQVAQGRDGLQADTSGIELRAIGFGQWTEGVQPDGLNGVDRRSIHFEQPVIKVRLLCKGCANL